MKFDNTSLRRFLLVWALIPAMGGLARDAGAQVLAGQVIDELTGRPVGRGFVVILDSRDREIGRVLTGPDGTYEVAVDPGQYRLRSERVGYRVAQTPLFDAVRRQRINSTFRISAIPFVLGDIVVETEDECRMDPADGADMAVLWEEARKALSAAVWTADRRAYRYVLGLYERELAPNARRVRNERLWTSTGSMVLPFESVAPERLAETGYVVANADGTASYHAPDPHVLLHESFHRRHCFRVVTDDDAGEVGLAFRPAQATGHPDVRGALWLDVETSELRRVEFLYTELDPMLAEHRPGGEIEFMAAPSGEWIVRSWSILMPEVGWAVGRRGRLPELIGHRDMGGEVLEMTDRDGVSVYAAEPAVVAGTVLHRERSVPLAGATVVLEGTSFQARTDSSGAFRLAGPFRGEYAVGVRHPLLDSMDFRVDPVTVDVEGRETANVELWVPPIAAIEAALCADAEPAPTGDGPRTLVGRVRDLAERPVSDARVTATWAVPRWSSMAVSRSVESMTHTDDAGRFVLCGLPVNRWIAVEADRERLRGQPKAVRFDEIGGVTVDDVAHRTARPIWREDFSIGRSRETTTALTGTITESTTGAPVVDATVRLGGTDRETRTDTAGSFRLDSLEAGTVQLLVRHLGFRPVVYTADIRSGQTLLVPRDVTALVSAPTELDPVTVEVDAPVPAYLQGFASRRAEGLGFFVTRAEFGEWNPTETTDVLRRTPGLSVLPNPDYGPGDARRYVFRNVRVATQEECPLLYFLDGAYIGDSSNRRTTRLGDLDQFVPVDYLEAIEVYKGPSEIPAQYNRTGSACGAIVFWTRQPPRR